jgi:hypothetical protein
MQVSIKHSGAKCILWGDSSIKKGSFSIKSSFSTVLDRGRVAEERTHEELKEKALSFPQLGIFWLL